MLVFLFYFAPRDRKLTSSNSHFGKSNLREDAMPFMHTVWLFHFHFSIFFISARVFVSLRVKPFKNNPVLTPLPRNPATQHADFATGRGSVTLPATQ